MTKPNSTDITIVLDRSGSMSSIADDMKGGFDTFIEEQKKIAGDCRVSLVRFDDRYEEVFTALPLSDVPKLELIPRGNTALHDAVGKTVVRTGERLAAMRESVRPSKVILLIITDGQENASREYTGHKVKAMIEHQKSHYQWEVTYLGANQDAVAVAAGLGVPLGQAVNYSANARGSRSAWKGLARSVGDVRSGVLSSNSAQDYYNQALKEEGKK